MQIQNRIARNAIVGYHERKIVHTKRESNADSLTSRLAPIWKPKRVEMARKIRSFVRKTLRNVKRSKEFNNFPLNRIRQLSHSSSNWFVYKTFEISCYNILTPFDSATTNAMLRIDWRVNKSTFVRSCKSHHSLAVYICIKEASVALPHLLCWL